MRGAWTALVERAENYRELGADRIVVGVPMDDLDNTTRGLDVLAELIPRFA